MCADALLDEAGTVPPPGDARLTLGLDVGGTKTALLLLDAAGSVVGMHRIPTEPECGAAHAMDAAAAEARREFGVEMDRVDAVGVAVAGQVGSGGVLVGAPNLGWDGADLRGEAERAFGLPAAILNDVRAAAWAEWRYGAGRGVDDLVVVFVGTGVG
ncbi:MAG: ROK family protein, partial [Gemmatimonadetes bacterium]|nr:ROK family protein [Gemmatimonadota bacterium]